MKHLLKRLSCACKSWRGLPAIFSTSACCFRLLTTCDFQGNCQGSLKRKISLLTTYSLTICERLCFFLNLCVLTVLLLSCFLYCQRNRLPKETSKFISHGTHLVTRENSKKQDVKQECWMLGMGCKPMPMGGEKKTRKTQTETCIILLHTINTSKLVSSAMLLFFLCVKSKHGGSWAHSTYLWIYF